MEEKLGRPGGRGGEEGALAMGGGVDAVVPTRPGLGHKHHATGVGGGAMMKRRRPVTPPPPPPHRTATPCCFLYRCDCGVRLR